jgi:hypothetical protein
MSKKIGIVAFLSIIYMMTSIFEYLFLAFISNNIPAAPVFTLSYIILGSMPSTMIFWTALSC